MFGSGLRFSKLRYDFEWVLISEGIVVENLSKIDNYRDLLNSGIAKKQREAIAGLMQCGEDGLSVLQDALKAVQSGATPPGQH